MPQVRYTVYGSWSYLLESERVHRLNRDGSIGGESVEVRAGIVVGVSKRRRVIGGFCPCADQVLELAEALRATGHPVEVLDANLQARKHERFRTIPTVIADVDGVQVYTHDIEVEADCCADLLKAGGLLDPERIMTLAREQQAMRDKEAAALAAERAEESALVARFAAADDSTKIGPEDIKTIARMLARALR